MDRANTDVNPVVKITVAVTYVGMVTVNALANILPINGIDTGAVSDSYPNLFAPAGLTFSIWGLIYLLLAGHTLFQLGLFRRNKSTGHSAVLNRIGIIFSLSSVANILWIFAWHYMRIPLSMFLMVVILICLILINNQTRKADLKGAEPWLVRLPFSVYFGWITVATIANATTLLVDLDWNGFGLSGEIWTIIILVVGILIGIATTIRNRDVPYGLVLIWAYSGILLKHVSPGGFDFQYPPIVYTVMGCLILILLTIIYVLRRRLGEERSGLL